MEDIRAWQAAYAFKLAIYKLIQATPIASDIDLRDQLRNSAASGVSQIEERYARFYPKDFGRFAVGSKASVAEARGHLRDAVDRGHITEGRRMEHDALAEEGIKELTGLIDYLQSPEAEENARRIKVKRAERRRQRQAAREQQSRKIEQKTPAEDPRTGNHE